MLQKAEEIHFWPVPGQAQCGWGTYSIFRWQVNSVCVEVLEEGTIHWVRKLVYFYHFFHVLIPVRLEHGSKVLTPKTGQQKLPYFSGWNQINKYHRYPYLLYLGQHTPGSRIFSWHPKNIPRARILILAFVYTLFHFWWVPPMKY